MSDGPPRIKVLCVDDHPILRQGIATLLCVEPDMMLVAEAVNGREAIQQFRAHLPDVTLMDLQMPGMGGLDAISALRAEFPEARIIVLTTYVDETLAQRAMQAGARGYLWKNALHRELLDAIRAVHAGQVALPSEASNQLAEQIAEPALTPAAVNLLRYIAASNAYPAIAQALALSEEAVRTQVQSLLSSVQASAAAPSAVPESVQDLVKAERDARFAAEAANRAKSEFLASMSHELRTPLNAVLGYAQLLALDPQLNEQQLRGLSIIHQSGQHLLSLIDDILDLARIGAGRTVVNPQPEILLDCLQAVVDLLQVKAQEKGLTFRFLPHHGLPHTVLIDARRLRQVLLNLLGNAIKFTDQGAVTLEVDAATSQAGDRVLRLSVSDTGVGMQNEDLARIFEPFEQVGETRRRSSGTGLGLAITRALLTEMGATLTVRSQPGQGSCFDVELPLTAMAPAPEPGR